MTEQEIKANIIKRDGYFSDARPMVETVTYLCDWETGRILNFFDEIVKTVCAEKLPSEMTKKELLESADKWVVAVRAVCAKSIHIVTINDLLDKISVLIYKGSMMECGGT